MALHIHPSSVLPFFDGLTSTTTPRRRAQMRTRTTTARRRKQKTEVTSNHIDEPAISGSNGGVSASVRESIKPPSLTGGAFDFYGATEPLVQRPIGNVKNIVLVRHGLSSWNEDKRIQGSSDLSVLSNEGIVQALKCKRALENITFDQCFASPISRAKSTAELIWGSREGELVFLDTLKEAHLHFLEGMRNEDAKMQYPELYNNWREDPSNFCIEGVRPVVDLWDTARKAWDEILHAKGKSILVVTHKSILRALICTALGMEPYRFRALDVHNGGISSFKVNDKGEPMLQCLNMTAHLHVDIVRY